MRVKENTKLLFLINLKPKTFLLRPILQISKLISNSFLTVQALDTTHVHVHIHVCVPAPPSTYRAEGGSQMYRAPNIS